MSGTTYTRQSTFADGDVITASLFNNEYNQLENAFVYAATGTTGHRHDGTNGQGGNIYIIGDQDFYNKIEVDSTNNRWGFYISVGDVAVEQIRLQDGALIPVTDNDIDLGTSSLEFKDLYIDGTANIDTLAADSGSITGNLSVGGNLTVTGNATINGNLTFGDAATDTVAFSADVNSNIIPDIDGTYNLGSPTQEWQNLYIDGTANIDSLIADTADINGGTIDGTAIGGAAASTGNFSTLSINGTAITATALELNTLDGITASTTELNILDGVTATTAELNYVDGVTSNIQTQLDLKAPKASPTFTGIVTIPTVDINGGAIDGTTIGASIASTGNFSTLSIGGVAITSTAVELNLLDGVTATTAEINYLDGVTSNIQTQINGLQSSDQSLVDISQITHADGKFIVSNGSNWVGETGATVRASLGLTIGTDVLAYDSNLQSFVTTFTVPTTDGTSGQALLTDGAGNISFGDVDALPTQTGNSGYFLTTDGTNASWAEVDALPTQTGNSGYYLTTNGTVASWDNLLNSPTFTGTVTFSGTEAITVPVGTTAQRPTATQGMIRYNTTDSVFEGYDGSAWGSIGTQYSYIRTNYTATASQTTFSATYTVGYVDVYLNGIKLVNSTDFTASNGTSIVLSSGATAGDLVEIIAFETFVVANALTAASFNSPTFTGTVTADGLTLGDNDKAFFGDGSDLQIYHDGSNSYIRENGVGSLLIQSNNNGIVFEKTDGENIGFIDTLNSRVVLYNGGSQKLATTATGIDVTGTVVADGLTVDGNGSVLTLDNGSNPVTISNTNGNVTTNFDTANVGRNYTIQNNSINAFRITNGDISFYEDTGTTPKFFWDASAESLGIGTTSPARTLSVNSAGIQIAAVFESTSTNTARISLVDANTTGDNFVSVASSGNDLALYAGAAEKMRITSTGNVGIGTTSPTQKLDVSGTVAATNIQETVYALTGTALDAGNGGIQTKTLAANTTFTDSLASGESLVLQLEAGASYTVTWPTMTWVTSGGNVAPTLTAKDTLVFWKVSSVLYGAYTGSYV